MSVADESLKTLVKEKYGRAAAEVRDGSAMAASCCGEPEASGASAAASAGAAAGATTEAGAAAAGCGCGSGRGVATDPIRRTSRVDMRHSPEVSSNLYGAEETAAVPEQALRASLGCGNPAALAELRPGEVVLDLGSGGGIDVLLSARRVGPTGKAYGLDMTDEMLALARDNQRRAGVENVEFLRGEIEAIPLPAASVDVIISNCVINLSGDKRRVLSEAFRVLKPGGRFAVSDVVVRGSLPPAVRRSMELWVGCVAGALEESEFKGLLSEIGFEHPEIEPTRIYRFEDARELLAGSGLDADALAAEVEGRVMGAFVRARKPAAA
jgi:arsenite methyltransferase